MSILALVIVFWKNAIRVIHSDFFSRFLPPVTTLCCHQLHVHFIFILLPGKELTIQDLDYPRLWPLSVLVKERRVNERHYF